MGTRTRLLLVVCRVAATTLLCAAAGTAACTHRSRAQPEPAANDQPPEFTSGIQVIEAVRDRYAGRWYGTLTFTQRTTTYQPGGGQPRISTWHEALRLPGRLRIDTDTSGSGALYVNDSIYVFTQKQLTRADSGMNDLLILGFDIYAQPAERSIEILKGRGFDLGSVHDDVFESTPVYVVGAKAGDSGSKQFWITKNDLLFVRLLAHRATQNGDVQTDVRFEDYRKVALAWLAERVVQMANGQTRVVEEYSDVQPNALLEEIQFEPALWSKTLPWWKK